MTSQTAPAAPPPTLADTFAALVREWREDFEVRFSSDPSAASRHPAYRKMMELGPAVLPLIFAELAASPSFRWFAALRELTGADPVPDSEWGTKASAGHWLAWGSERGLA